MLHLATHAVFRSDNPELSSIKLADAWLTVSDLAEIAHGAQLVTLSACETGKTGIKAGDEANCRGNRTGEREMLAVQIEVRGKNKR